MDRAYILTLMVLKRQIDYDTLDMDLEALQNLYNVAFMHITVLANHLNGVMVTSELKGELQVDIMELMRLNSMDGDINFRMDVIANGLVPDIDVKEERLGLLEEKNRVLRRQLDVCSDIFNIYLKIQGIQRDVGYGGR